MVNKLSQVRRERIDHLVRFGRKNMGINTISAIFREARSTWPTVRDQTLLDYSKTALRIILSSEDT